MALSLDGLRRMMLDRRVTQLYLKRLASNDNSKNQVYLGSDFESLNVLPTRGVQPDSRSGHPIFKAGLDFTWLDTAGADHPATGSQLILYPQYPEVRLSGFLRGSLGAPSKLMASRTPGRLLLLGVRAEGQIVAFATGPESELAKEISGLVGLEKVGVFERVPLEYGGRAADSRTKLLTELGRIHRLGWIASKKLTATGAVGPCLASQCGGYTLEAELGIIPNADSEPDFEGWEIKQHAVANFKNLDRGVLTLMTPEPTSGLYRSVGVANFIRRFGYPDRHGRPDRLNFGGVYRVGVRHPKTGLTLGLDGFDSATGSILDANGGITLRSAAELAARWSFVDLMEHWNRKHARAAYVPSRMAATPSLRYCYGGEVRLGEGTDFLKLLRAFSRGSVYYDPGIKLEGVSTSKPRTKRRSQFRVSSKNLSALYSTFETVPVAVS